MYIVAEVDKRHHNLRSGIDTVQLPVQIHMSNESEFMSKLAQNEHDLDADDFGTSEFNCSAIVESSGSERTPGRQTTQSNASTSREVHCRMLPLSRP